MNKLSLLFCIWCILTTSLVSGQKKTETQPALYFNQIPPLSSPVIFAPGTISTKHHEHSRIEFSPSGQEMIWAVIPIDPQRVTPDGPRYRNDLQKIWFTRMGPEGWNPPEILPLTKSMGARSPTFSPDGKTLYFTSSDPTADPQLKPKPQLLFKSTRLDGVWKKPTPVSGLFPERTGKGAMASFCFARNGSVYYDLGQPTESGQWNWKIYTMALVDGHYQPPIELGDGINVGPLNWCPWIAPDESYLIWSSHREGEFGNGDLYISFKTPAGAWHKPVNMGQAINTSSQERFPSVSPDGKYLFFTRHLDSISNNDFYWVETKILDNLKAKAE